jgi:hypothetical protein
VRGACPLRSDADGSGVPEAATGGEGEGRFRALFAGLGDLHAELTVLGRYLLSVIDEEIELSA